MWAKVGTRLKVHANLFLLEFENKFRAFGLIEKLEKLECRVNKLELVNENMAQGKLRSTVVCCNLGNFLQFYFIKLKLPYSKYM